MENNIKTKTPKLEIVQASGPTGIVVQGTVNGNGNVAVINTVSVDTELSGELSSFPDITSGLKLVTLQAPSGVVDTISVLTPTATGKCQYVRFNMYYARKIWFDMYYVHKIWFKMYVLLYK